MMNHWHMLNIVIQLGAILAVVVIYWRTFWTVLVGLFKRDPGSVRFVRNLLIAFIPATVIGVLAKKHIEALLLQPKVVAVALIVGGIAILVIERVVKPGATRGIAAVPARTALGVGFPPGPALLPGVRRSGATSPGPLTPGCPPSPAARVRLFPASSTPLAVSA